MQKITEYAELGLLAKHYFALICVVLIASYLPQIRSAASGNKFKFNHWRFILGLSIVLVLEGIIKDYVPNYIRISSFLIAFYCEEIYDWAKGGLINKLLKVIEEIIFKRKNDCE